MPRGHPGVSPRGYQLGQQYAGQPDMAARTREGVQQLAGRALGLMVLGLGSGLGFRFSGGSGLRLGLGFGFTLSVG